MKTKIFLSFLFIILASIFANAQNNLSGKYQYSYRHETGRDSFVYNLKSNGTALYTSNREGEGREDKIGFWRWDKTEKLMYVTLTDSKGKKETHTFAVLRGTLVMRKDSTGWLFLVGKTFRKKK